MSSRIIVGTFSIIIILLTGCGGGNATPTPIIANGYIGEKPVVIEITETPTPPPATATPQAAGPGEQPAPLGSNDSAEQPEYLSNSMAGLSETAQLLVQEGFVSEREGDIADMVAYFEEAEALDPDHELFLGPDLWEYACRTGIMYRMAEKVMDACDRAISEAMDDGKEGSELIDYYDGRGIARALAGDEVGATEDFQFYLVSQEDSYQAEIRESWFVIISDGLPAPGAGEPLPEEAGRWNRACWFGSLHGLAPVVLPACDLAVDIAEESQLASIRDSRGLARALTGDANGAIEDFQAFVDYFAADDEYEELVQQRQDWIAELDQGANPIDRAALEALLDG